MTQNEVLALITFTIAGSGSPGPNNALLLASGVSFGFSRTVPHVLGATMGVGLLVMSVAAGVGGLLERYPEGQMALKIVGSAYLAYLALRSLSAHTAMGASAAKPLRLWEAILFQFVNPKAWLLAIGVVAAFLPPSLPWMVGAATVAVIFASVSSLCFTVWSAGGVALARLVTSERTAHLVNIALGLLLMASVALIWL